MDPSTDEGNPRHPLPDLNEAAKKAAATRKRNASKRSTAANRRRDFAAEHYRLRVKEEGQERSAQSRILQIHLILTL